MLLTYDDSMCRCFRLVAIQQRDPGWYEALVRPLTSEQKKDLQEIFKLAEQRRAVQGTYIHRSLVTLFTMKIHRGTP